MPEILFLYMMLYLFQNLQTPPEDEVTLPLWILPVLLVIVMIGILGQLLRLIEHGYANWFSRPLYRSLFTHRKISSSQKEWLEENFLFYKKFHYKDKRLFDHRLNIFLREKEFLGMNGMIVTPQHKLAISAHACLMCLGRKYHSYPLIERIEIYPDIFYNEVHEAYLEGAFLPMQKTLALSPKQFSTPGEGHRNLLFHELMHALQWESRLTENFDSERFRKYYKKIVQRLSNEKEVRERLKNNFFRDYAFTNEFEFMAELSEYFFQKPHEFRRKLPQIFQYIKKIFNIDIEALVEEES